MVEHSAVNRRVVGSSPTDAAFIEKQAGMAESEDARDLKSLGFTPMWVQVPLPAFLLV